jgi:glycosyltransferase involved in cell wall biosynthesis
MKKRLRVSVVTETYPPEINGVALSLARLLEGVRSHCHLELLRVDRSDLQPCPPNELRLAGFPLPGYARLRGGFPAWLRLWRRWSLQRPDVVHLATEGPLGFSALQVARRLRIAVSSDFRTHFEQYVGHYRVGWLEPFAAAYLRAFHNRCHLTCVPTQALRLSLEAKGFQRLSVVPRGVDLSRFAPTRRRESLRATWSSDARHTPILVCVSRMAAEKNLEVLLEAFRSERARGRRVELLMVGDGPIRATLENRYPEARFVGMKTGQDLAEHYASADLFCFPSQSETFGNVTLEAMASGLPVIAYRHGAAAALLQDQTQGWVLDDFSAQAFSSALEHALNRWEREGPLAWQAMGFAARACAQMQSWEAVVGQMLGHWYALARYPAAELESGAQAPLSRLL